MDLNPAPSVHSRRWIVSQIGARQHYTIPLGFHQLGCLDSFYTDLWAGSGSRLLRHLGSRSSAFAGRYSSQLPKGKVIDFTAQTMWRSLLDRHDRSLAARYEQYITKGRQFAEAVNRHLLPRLGRIPEPAFFTFNTGALETLEALGREGVPTVVDQIDPARSEEQIILEEVERWPGWQPLLGKIPNAYFERLDAEWSLADVVVVNSTWCRDALVQQAVPAEKIAVAPIAYTAPRPPTSAKVARPTGSPLRVLWLGQVILRKGIQYLMEAARLLLGKNVEFRIVGPIGISREAVASAPSNMIFEGPLPRLETQRAYSWADVFVLPTLSDGFAITQLEALAAGLPVITTRSCGDVVTHGKDGMIVPIRDPNALARAIEYLADNPGSLAAMSREAMKTVNQFGVEQVARQRLDAISKAMLRTMAAAK